MWRYLGPRWLYVSSRHSRSIFISIEYLLLWLLCNQHWWSINLCILYQKNIPMQNVMYRTSVKVNTVSVCSNIINSMFKCLSPLASLCKKQCQVHSVIHWKPMSVWCWDVKCKKDNRAVRYWQCGSRSNWCNLSHSVFKTFSPNDNTYSCVNLETFIVT